MVAVKPESGENIEKAIRKFLKKCKKLRIVENYRDRQYYVKPAEKRRQDKIRRKRVLDKLRRESQEDN